MISKLPQVGISIFTEISAKATAAKALNLAQGFPDLPVDQDLIDRLCHYVKSGANQYAPGDGVMTLRKKIALLTDQLYGYLPDAESEITITSGATEGLNDAFAALVNPGDEVIVLEPAYDAYIPGILLHGGIPVSVKLDTDTFKVSWEDIERSISDKTKAIIINNPHNPTGTTWDQDDIRTLSQLADKYDLIVISDEVYHHLIFDNQSHLSVLSDEALRKRSIVLFSFGKTFHVTGWKVGYVIAPALYTDEIRKMHQFATFCVHTPTQLAIADALTIDRVRKVNDSFEGKRDRLIKGLSETKFSMKPASGTYFQTVNYRQYNQKNDRQWVDELILNPGIAMIPLSPFYQDETQTYQLRICFAKSNETLDSAINILQAL